MLAFVFLYFVGLVQKAGASNFNFVNFVVWPGALVVKHACVVIVVPLHKILHGARISFHPSLVSSRFCFLLSWSMDSGGTLCFMRPILFFVGLEQKSGAPFFNFVSFVVWPGALGVKQAAECSSDSI